MKSKTIVPIVIIIMIVITGVIIYNIPKIDAINQMAEESKIEYYYCEGTHCRNKDPMPIAEKTTGKCEMCERPVEAETNDIDKLCAKCSKSAKECIHCAEKLTDEKIAENKLRKKQFAKYNAINIAENKIAAIPNSNKIVFLTKDYANKENNNSILIVYDMQENKEIERIDLKNDYIVVGQDVTFDIAQEIENGMSVEEAQKTYKTQEKAKKEYEALGRLFYINNKIVLITPDENKNFVYDMQTKEISHNLKSLNATFGDEQYYYVVDTKDNKTYYYFERYDLYTDNIENINLEKYILDSAEFNVDEMIDYEIKVMKSGEEYLISYYDERYGKLKVKYLNSNKEEIKEVLSSEILFESKNRIVLYNYQTKEEIWSYDKTLNDKMYEEYFGM